MLANEIDIEKCWEKRNVPVLVGSTFEILPEASFQSEVHGDYWPSCMYGGIDYIFASWVHVRNLNGYQVFCGAIRRQEPSGIQKWGALINRGATFFIFT